MAIQHVEVRALEPARLATLIGDARADRFDEAAAAARALLEGRAVFNVNSTSKGGGVAEMLQTLLAYARGVGVDARWLVIGGDAEFFTITKRLHNNLYGAPGDGGPLADRERRHYEAVLRTNAAELVDLVRPGDLMLLHDPQTLGLVTHLRDSGAHVVWRCHIGLDTPNEHSERAWDYLRPYLDEVPALVFSRLEHAPSWLPQDRVFTIPPSIDPFSAKNEWMNPDDVRRTLQYVGLLDGGSEQPLATFTRRDGSPGRIDRHADILQTGPPPPIDTMLVVQASRWDPVKDMDGVMRGFARGVPELGNNTHLVLAGPSVHGVADDPEAAATLDTCMRVWAALPDAARSRIHLACVPMADPDEAAAIVNALQRRATVVVQKSLAEGFGLTVTEAMWKSRPVVASAVGGIRDQVVPGETGLLLDDPRDLDAFAASVGALLADPGRAESMGAAGHRRAKEQFLGDRHLEQWAELFTAVLAG